MNSRKSLIVALTWACSLLLLNSGAWGWVRNISTAGLLYNIPRASAVAVDSAGNVTLGGYAFDGCCDGSGIVVKLSGSDGAEIWRRLFGNSDYGYVYAIALDSVGNVVAAGNSWNCINQCGSYFTVMKFHAATGTELWRNDIRGPTGGYENWAFAVTLDGAGDVVAAGTTDNAGYTDFTVVKFNGATGVELWRKQINGTANGYNYSADSIVVDAAGNVLAAGSIVNNGSGYDFTVVKIEGSSGVELWRRVIDGSDSVDDRATAIAVDASGDVITAGATNDCYGCVTTAHFTVIKFAGASGSELWRKELNSTVNGFTSDNPIVVDAAGNVVVAGGISNANTFTDFAVIKFNGATGAELWRQLINGTANSVDSAQAVAVDSAGNIVAGGYTWNTGTDYDFTVVKFDGANGAELWRHLLTGYNTPFWPSMHSIESAAALAIDSAGNVVAAGNTGFDFVVAKLPGSGPVPVVLSVTPLSVTAGATVTATWNDIASPMAGDWIGLYVPGASDSSLVANSWIYPTCSQVKGSTGIESGSCSFQIPASLAAGTYELRLFANNSLIRLAKSGPFTVQAAPPATLSVSPSNITAGTSITATWTAIASPMAGDWIGLYVPGAADSALISNTWVYVSCSQTKGSSGVGSGSCSFLIPASVTPGAYELRLFANNSLLRLGRSGTFTVQAAALAPAAVLSATPSSVTAGAPVTATWNDIASPMAGDWIGLYVPGASDSALIASTWVYVSCSQVKGSSGVASGSCLFPIPSSLAAGTYELRIFANNSLVRLATSGAFTVQGAPPATLSVSPSSVSAGANVTVTWSDILTPAPGDWIGLYVPGSSDSALVTSTWIYVSCSQVKGSSGVASGSCSFQIPASLAAGTYELRLFANNSLVRLGRSNAIAVN